MSTKFLFLATSLVAISLIAAAFIFNNGQNKIQDGTVADDRGFAVVELFTSEGCSSCPPADELLAELKTTMGGKSVFFLAFHVDYWDYLGWRDKFSDASFSKRQQQYASELSLNVYTPQMIVNGKIGFVGSSSHQAKAAIAEGLNNPATKRISFENNYDKNSKKVNIKFNISDGSKDEVLNIALLQKESISSVSRGENGGKKLRHVNVVRSFFTTPSAGEGNAEISFPADLINQTVTIVCYTQNKKSLEITGAAARDILLNPE
ncbi:MAG: DUF1223 domain-containing protein [Chitinophagales bacterium]